MIVRYRALCLLAVWCAGQITLSAESKPLELRWTELAPLIASHGVELTLRSGGKVSGEAIAVREDTLLVDVKKSSETQSYAKGNAAVPRSEIALITLRRSRGTWGRTLGTTVGVVAGLGAGGYAAVRIDSGGESVAVLVAVTSGLAVGGYYLGRLLDRRTTRITIAP